MCGILKFKPTIKMVIPSIALFVARFGFMHSVFSYSLFGIPNWSALEFVFVVPEIFSIILEISPIMLALCFVLSIPYYA